VLIDGKDRTADAKISVEKFPDTPSMLVRVPYVPDLDKYTITISLGPDPQLSVLDHRARIEKMLLDYQTEFDIKDRLWSIVDDRESAINVKIGKLMSLSVDERLTEPVAELLLSDARGVHV